MIFATKMPNGTLRQCHATRAQRDAADCPYDLEEGSLVALNEHGLECHLACLAGTTAETTEQQPADDQLSMQVQWPAARKTPPITTAAVAQKDLLSAAADVFAGPEKDDHK